MKNGDAAKIQTAVDWLRTNGAETPALGLVLGSGLGAFAERVEDAAIFPYDQIPGFPVSTVSGHAGRLVVGRLAGVPVAVMQGRVHLYEGYAPAEAVFPVRCLVAMGARGVVLTNAAGGIGAGLGPGSLMLLTDHLNLTGMNPLYGTNEDALGPRFPDMSEVYSKAWRARAEDAAKQRKIALHAGVYAAMLGPSYETPAEIRMLERMGADAVGMSTVLEAIAIRHMGAEVLGISCISNLAAGKSEGPLSHDEVKEAADAAADAFSSLLAGIVAHSADRFPGDR